MNKRGEIADMRFQIAIGDPRRHSNALMGLGFGPSSGRGLFKRSRSGAAAIRSWVKSGQTNSAII